MGSSLSRQEELFVSCQWAQLLQESMTTPAVGSITRREDDRRHGFCMTFTEWQAFLSLLESGSTAAAPAAMLHNKLAENEICCPAVSLVVYLCAWWGHALDDDTLRARMAQLVYTVVGRDAAKHATTAPAPQTRRRRLAQVLRRRFPGGAHRPAESASQLSTQYLADAVELAESALDQHSPTSAQGDSSDPTTVNAPRSNSSSSSDCDSPAGVAERQRCCRRAFDALCAVPAERPVLRVAVSLLLAVFAAATTTAMAASLVELGVEQLRVIEHVMASGADKVRDKMGNSRDGAGLVEQCPRGVALLDRWRLLAELETALVRQQRLRLDVPQCLGEAGAALRRDLAECRAARAVVDSSSTPLSESERWELSMSQYIGQRHIWATLRTHFLSAGVFQADKATVMVFFGPSGYGKTELAKRVASAIHGIAVDDLEASGLFVHIHMPSFCTKEGIYSLVDPPAAHIGDGILLSALIRHPDAVVVLDEFEKSTTEAIQNLWLSAFQKKGTLRSLKNAERSVSTVKTTFILTCNIAAELIQRRTQDYLAASPAAQAAMRHQFELVCREACKKMMNEPFVNRVDYFFPFVPYSSAERRRFVVMLLERLLDSQARKGRKVYVTPRFVNALLHQVTTFHAATIEEIVKPLIMRMVAQGWSAAVLSVEKRVRPGAETRYVIVPAHASEVAPEVSEQESDVVLSQAWDALPGGAACLQLWGDELRDVGDEALPGETALREVSNSSPAREPAVAAASVTAGAITSFETSGGVTQLELARETHTVRELTLEKALAQARDTIVAQERSIARLTEKATVLEKALALMMCLSLCSMLVLSVILGVKVTLMLSVLAYLIFAVLLKLPLRVLLDAMRALYSLLGPRNAALLGLALLCITSQAARRAWRCR